jgi:hypothetical protein
MQRSCPHWQREDCDLGRLACGPPRGAIAKIEPVQTVPIPPHVRTVYRQNDREVPVDRRERIVAAATFFGQFDFR